MGFEHVVTARFYEVDQVGIVFFGRIFEYCHQAFEELMVSIFGDAKHAFSGPDAKTGWGTPLVHAEADFKGPIRLGDRLTVVVELEELTPKTLTFRYSLNGRDGKTRAVAKLVHAAVDLSTFKSCPVPDELLTGLRRVGLLAGE